MGENTLALLNYLTSPATSMGNSPTATALPKAATSDTVFFSALAGHVFVVFTRAQGSLIYGTLSALSAIVVINRVDWSRKAVYLAGLLGVTASFLGALIGANLGAFATSVLLNKSLTWYISSFTRYNLHL